MAYEKKIEPLSRWEVFMAGFCLQIFILLIFIVPWMGFSETCVEIFFKVDIKSFDDLQEFHECLIDHRSGFLAACSTLLLGYPFIIAHLFFEYRMSETITSFLNINLFRWLGRASWAIAATIYCTVVPAIGIFCVYYDWEFESSVEYVGYAMQFRFFEFAHILTDCLMIPLGIAAAVPQLIGLAILFGWFPSQNYQLSEDGRTSLLGIYKVLNIRASKIFITIFSSFVICVSLFGSFADVFDYEKDGFFSYQGGSQFLKLTLLLAWEIQAITVMRLSCKLDKQMAYLNDNVTSMASQDATGTVEMR